MSESYGVTFAIEIELDGSGHNFAAKESLDQARTRFLASKDI